MRNTSDCCTELQLPEHTLPYTVSRFMPTPMGKAAYYQMFMFPFASPDALQQALNNPVMGELAADALRISSGEAPVFLAGRKQVTVLHRTLQAQVRRRLSDIEGIRNPSTGHA